MCSILFVVGGAFFSALGSLVEDSIYAGIPPLEVALWAVGIIVSCAAVWGLFVVAVALFKLVSGARLSNVAEAEDTTTDGPER